MPLTTDQVRQLASQGPLSTSQVQTLATPTAPVSTTPTTPTITAASLAPQTPIQPVLTEQPQVPVVSPYTLTADETQAETQETDLSKLIAGLTAETSTPFQEDARLKAEEAQGISAKKSALAGLQNTQKSLLAESQGIQLQLQQDIQNQQNLAQQGGANVTKGGLAPQTRALQTVANQSLLSNAIKQYGNNASLAAAQGDLASAMDYVDRAIQAEFLPKEKALAVAQANLTNLQKSGTLTRAQQKRADERQALIDAQRDTLETAKEDKKSIQNLAVQLSRFGVDPTITRKVQGATSFDDALSIASPYMQDPMSKFELENARLDNILTQERIATERKQRSLMGQQTQAETKASQAEQKAIIETSKQAKAQIPAIQSKINTLNSIASHKGLAGSVGAYGVSRFTPLTADKAERQDFKAKIHQLTGELTLDQLINAKARGATFGALSEGELGILAKSATTLNDWEVKDEKGQGTGEWEIDEKSFLAEINKIKELAERDRAMRTGEVFTPDERGVLDQVFLTPSTYQQGNFDPSLFY